MMGYSDVSVSVFFQKLRHSQHLTHFDLMAGRAGGRKACLAAASAMIDPDGAYPPGYKNFSLGWRRENLIKFWYPYPKFNH